jgi:cytochrome P450
MTKPFPRTMRTAQHYRARAQELLAMPGPFPAAPPDSGLRTVQGEPGLPIIGHSVDFVRDPLAVARQHYDRYGPVSWTCALGIRGVLALGPEASETVLANRDKAFANGPGWGFLGGPFFRRGILMLDFEEHHHHRRIMQQAFIKPRLQGYLHGMNPAIARGITAWQPTQGFLVLPAIKELTLDLATEIFVGVKLGPEADRVNQAFIDALRATLAPVRFALPGNRWSRGLAGRRVLEDFFAERLPAKRAGDGPDLFTALCHAQSEDGQRFSDIDVINHMIFVLFAAHDTSTVAMNTMIYYLAKHPEWQDRVRQESLALGKPTLEYDELKEALRLNPPVPGFARRTVKDTQVCGYYLPKGTWTAVWAQFTHHMREYWPEPERFDPERFAEHRREDKVHKYAWEPFGGGVHKCIGMYFAGIQIKAILHQMLQRYRWSVDPDYDTVFDFSTLPVPKDGLPVRLERIG